jgi:hypothetical protein
MKKTTLVMLTMAAAAAASTGGCGVASPDVSTSVAAIRNCPNPDDCVPSPPDDPPPKPPKTPLPPQPDPAKFRTVYLSTDYIRNALNDYLAGTKIQITNTQGDPLAIPAILHTCTPTNSTPEQEQECIDLCNSDSTLTPVQKAQCRHSCATTQTCTSFCGTTNIPSYLRWGNTARAASVVNSKRTCDATTCPACATPMPAPTLDNIPLDVEPFSNTYGVGPASVTITCKVNRWVFQVAANIEVEATPNGLWVTVPGTTGDPALYCNNAPDPTVDGLGLTLWFSFPWATGEVKTEASLDGDWHVFGSVIDFLADMNGRISSAVADSSRDALSSYSKTFWTAFEGVTAKYAYDVRGETLDKLGTIEAQYGQLKVGYWVK